MKRIYEVWIERDNNSLNDIVLFQGSKTAAYAYYRKHGGYRAGLHIGYIL